MIKRKEEVNAERRRRKKRGGELKERRNIR